MYYNNIKMIQKDKVMKIKIKQARAFSRGLEDGAHRLFTETPEVQSIRNGFNKKFENDAYIAGYNLANKNDMYFFAWKANKSLLELAIQSGDVKPIGFELYNGVVEEISNKKYHNYKRLYY